MITSDRRLQEGSQALGIAFNIARAQEALYRLSAGQQLEPNEHVYFDRIASLFAKAHQGFHWVDALTHGTARPFEADTVDQLQALRLLLPVVASAKPDESFTRVAEVAEQLRDGKLVDGPGRDFFNAVLDALATYAVAEGSDAIRVKCPLDARVPIVRRMTQPASPEPALSGIVERLEVWSRLLRKEIEDAQRAGRDGGDEAALAFLNLLADVLDEQERAFSRYRASIIAAPEVRLRWLQSVGAGLGLLVHYLGTLERALPPRLTPLVSAFERLLGELIPGKAAVVVPERFFNYELREIHARSFEQVLGTGVDRHPWPALFLKLPLGLLDSPRNHILLAHELGHALAAMARAAMQKHLRLVEEAKRAGTNPPAAPEELLPRPVIDTARILPIAQQMCRESGINVSAPAVPGQVGIGQRILQGLIAKVASDASSITERWVEELFADAVGVCLFGPAFTKAFTDVLLPTGRLAQASHDHPPHAVRITFQRDLLARAEFGDFAAVMPPKLKERLDAVATLAMSALPAVPGSTASASEREIYGLSHDSVQTVLEEIMTVAITRAGNLLYSAAQYRDDLDRHFEPFRTLGVPPIGVVGERRVSLATILNIGQLVAMEAPVHVPPTADALARERGLDDLILKAIELAEFQIDWENA